MKKRIGKKGMVFNIVIVILTVVVLTYAYIRLAEKTENLKKIGTTSLEMVGVVQEGEKALVYLDLSAKLSMYQAIYDLQSSGGVKEAAGCGKYFGFNMWNKDGGKTCFVNSKDAKESLKDYFTPGLVARVANYPNADFIGNTKAASIYRGESTQASQLMGVAVGSQAAVTSCQGTLDSTIDYTFDNREEFFPAKGARIYIPAEANCAGSYPLIVFLHGCGKPSEMGDHINMGGQKKPDLRENAKQLISTGKIRPFILAAPSQNGPLLGKEFCGGRFWATDLFAPDRFVDTVRQKLPQGVTISSISFVGHSGAGCPLNNGIFNAAKLFPSATAIGVFDSCKGANVGESLKAKLGSGTKLMVAYGPLYYSSAAVAAENAALGIKTKIACPDTAIPGASLTECYSDGNYIGYEVKGVDHYQALAVGFEQFLLKYFGVQAAGGQNAN